MIKGILRLGGGILLFTILANLNAIELSTIIPNCSINCEITTNYDLITNNGTFTENKDGIRFNARITEFINYGNITKTNSGNQSFGFESSGYVARFVNYGTIDNSIWIANSAPGLDMFSNYGTLKGGISNEVSNTLIINNLGSMGWWDSKGNINTGNNAKVLIQNYALTLNETATEFNKFSGGGDKNSHLVISGGGVTFKDGDSKIILGFGEKFEFGEKYLIGKLATDTDGSAYSDLSVDFSRLIPKSDIYTLYKQGDYFIARLQPQHSAISNLYKANIHTMNNFQTMSNSMIYPRKSYHSQNLGRTHSLLQHSPSLSTSGARGWVEYPSLRDSANLNISSLRASERKRGNPQDLQALRSNHPFIKESLDSAIPLKSYESFSYRNESVNRRIQRQNKRNYNRRLPNQSTSQKLKENQRNSQNLKENQNNPQTQTFSQNLSQTPHNYYFILTPFVNHNLFFESGNYNLSGFDYGFLTAFSAKVAESNSLGAHFIFSYGSLGDKKDKDLSIKSLNLNVGLNYKLDLIYDMYLKARGDFFYFSNQVKTLTMFEAIKPNNLGFGVSVAYGKDFNFGKGGVLGIEAGIDYKALKTNEVLLNSQTYKQSLLNLIYADLGINYNKYFGGFGLNVGTGFKANLAPKLAESALLLNSQTLKFTLDNDKYLAYANAGISYVLNTKNFDMEFSLAYYGNYGDRVISNGGGVEWRVGF